jgi:hypothetical protein
MDVFELQKSILPVLRLAGQGKPTRAFVGFPRLTQHLEAAMSHLLLTDETFLVQIDPSLSLSQMIAAGRFQRVAKQFGAANFDVLSSSIRDAQVSVAVIGQPSRVATSDVLTSLANLGKRPARIEELLALAAFLQDGHLRLNANALGSLWRAPDGELYVPSCSLKTVRRLRFLKMEWEPAWSRAWDCFPCLPIET